MKKTYFVSLALVLAMLAGAMILSGMSLGVYVDLPSLAIVVGFTFVLLLASFSPAEMGKAFRAAFSGNTKEEFEKGIVFFSAMQKYFIVTGILGTLLGGVALLAMSNSVAGGIGRGFAVALLTTFYAVVFTLVLPIPFIAGLKKRLAELG